jgi:hypothetical protein
MLFINKEKRIENILTKNLELGIQIINISKKRLWIIKKKKQYACEWNLKVLK